MTTLNTTERDVLAELRDNRPRMAAEVAEAIGAPPYAVRGVLNELRRRRLVHRDMLYQHCITERGHGALLVHDQLELFR